MLLTLANVIVNAYMYSIHSLFIAIDKVKVYSIMIFFSGCISTILTLIITKFTNLGIYAIAGTSTIILSLVNLLVVPLYAEHSLRVPSFTLLKTIFMNYLALCVNLIVFVLLKPYIVAENWLMFLISMGIIAIPTYFITFCILLNHEEKVTFFEKIKKKLWRR